MKKIFIIGLIVAVIATAIFAGTESTTHVESTSYSSGHIETVKHSNEELIMRAAGNYDSLN